MPYNLLKVYSDLLEITHMNEQERTKSLQRIFLRDIEQNEKLEYRNHKIRPIKGEEPSMQILFKHLTCEEIIVEEDGRKYKKRIFEIDRSQRLHWVRFHLDEKKKENMEVFSIEERID